MKQNELRPPIGAKHRRKRVGRGDGSGHGTYCGKGCKGQKARSGGGVRLGFEGGQLPLIKKLPQKRGFFNRFKKEYNVVNISKLDAFPPGSEVNLEDLLRRGLIKSLKRPTKILGKGDIHHPLLVKANCFSASAEKKIVAAEGRVQRV